ncbi:MAG TPA: molybdate ABC transporter substrate-binding protein [Bryobacteraceae bacterium]|nr:molybdate ABC transporter substrate-binding protein [Bryobacteraceae bacterium]
MKASALSCLLLLLAACGGQRAATLTVSAAASLQNALAPVADTYRREHPGTRIDFNFGASGALARQIEDGAPVDVFFSAAAGPMDGLERRGLLLAGTRHDVLRGDVVLIAPRDAAGVASFDALATPAVKLVALGDPASVPAGTYGKQALTAMGLWERVQPKLVLANDVRQVLSYVESGNADAGIVYATDARQSPKVRVAAVAPESTHAPVVYPVAVLRGARDPAAARQFAAFLSGQEAGAILASQGFRVAER